MAGTTPQPQPQQPPQPGGHYPQQPPAAPPQGYPQQQPAYAHAQAQAQYAAAGQQQYAPQAPQQPGPHQPGPQMPGPATVGAGEAGFGRILVSEWTKLRTVRSTIWSIIAILVIMIGLSMAVCGSGKVTDTDEQLGAALTGLVIAVIPASTLGVLTISSEYSTGMIRTTFTAFPRRAMVLVAKALVFAVVMFVIGVVATWISYEIGHAMLNGKGITPTGKELERAVIGGGAYLSAVGVMGIGLGALLRHSAGAISTILGVILLPFIIGPMLPSSIGHKVMEFSPINAAVKLIGNSGFGAQSGWHLLGIVALYSVAVFAAGAVLINSRDV